MKADSVIHKALFNFSDTFKVCVKHLLDLGITASGEAQNLHRQSHLLSTLKKYETNKKSNRCVEVILFGVVGVVTCKRD